MYILPKCPDSSCVGSCVEKPGDWWYCGMCCCWFPGAHLRLKGLLGKGSPKGRPKREKQTSSIVKKKGSKKTLVSSEQSKKVIKKKIRSKGIRRPRI